MRTLVTKQSETKRREKHDIYEKRIAASIEDKEVARSQGDLSENFGYTEALKEIENQRRMQTDLGLHNPGVEIIDPMNWAEMDMEEPYVRLGAKVGIEINGERQTILIGGAWDFDLGNEAIVPYSSPLGQALMRKEPGFTTKLETSGETVTVLSAEVPTKEDLEGYYPSPTKKKVKDKEKPALEI